MSTRQRRQKIKRAPLVAAYGTEEQRNKLVMLADHLEVSHSNLVALLIERAFDDVIINGKLTGIPT